MPELTAAVTATVNANLAGDIRPDDQFPLMDVHMATSHHTKEFIVVPQTKGVTCRRDRQLGAVFVDTLVGDDHVGPATVTLSCECHATAAGLQSPSSSRCPCRPVPAPKLTLSPTLPPLVPMCTCRCLEISRKADCRGHGRLVRV